MADTLSDAFDFWGGHYNRAVNSVAATVGMDAHAAGLTSKPHRQEQRRGPPTGLEFANCLTTDGGLVMVQDLPPTEVSRPVRPLPPRAHCLAAGSSCVHSHPWRLTRCGDGRKGATSAQRRTGGGRTTTRLWCL
jgi:hypothetical protein